MERREWIYMMKARQKGKVPTDITKFYKRNELETPLTPEEQAKKDAEEEEKAKKKKDKGKDKKKKAKKKKGKDDDSKNIAKIGPSEVALKFDEFYEAYNMDWANRDETKNIE